jgi:hypothetical protein
MAEAAGLGAQHRSEVAAGEVPTELHERVGGWVALCCRENDGHANANGRKTANY